MQVESLISHRNNVHLTKTGVPWLLYSSLPYRKKKTGSISARQEQLCDNPTNTLSRILNHWKLSSRHIWLHLKPGSISFWTCTAAFMISQLRMMSLQVFLLLLLSQWAALFQGKCFYIVLKIVFLQLTIYQSMLFLRRDLERLVSKCEINLSVCMRIQIPFVKVYPGSRGPFSE